MNPDNNSNNPAQQYNGNTQPVQPNNGYTPQGNTPPVQPQSDQAPNAQAGYEWLATYNNQPTQAQKGDSIGKKLLFMIGVVAIIVICSLLMVFSLGKSNKQSTVPNDTTSTQQTADQSKEQNSSPTEADAKRQEMLKKLQSRLEEYYSAFVYYPTFDDVSSPEWLKKYNVTDKEISDPEGNMPVIKRIPSTNHFSYQPSPEGCNNTSTECTGYTISTVLSNADIIELKNL